jgi:cobaltochelatase CobS
MVTAVQPQVVTELSKQIAQMNFYVPPPPPPPIEVEDDDVPYTPYMPKKEDHFFEDPKVLKPLEWAIKNKLNCLLVGPPGIGKTSLALNVCARMKKVVEVASISGETNTEKLIGQQSIALVQGERLPIAVLGPVALAFKHGATLILDEVDFLSPEVGAELHPFLETSTKEITLFLGKKVHLVRHPNFHVIMTANTIGTGEDSFQYTGTKILNAALMSRVSIVVRQSYLPKIDELKVLRSKVPNAQGLDQMLEVASDSRTQVENEVLTKALSPRDLLVWASLLAEGQFTWLESASLAFINKASKEDAIVLTTLVTNRKPKNLP